MSNGHMPHGIEIFSFDIFGFSRRLPPLHDRQPAAGEALCDAATAAPQVKPKDEEPPVRSNVMFWGMFPVL